MAGHRLFSTVEAVSRGVWGVFDVEDTLLTSIVDGWTEEAYPVKQVFAAGTLVAI